MASILPDSTHTPPNTIGSLVVGWGISCLIFGLLTLQVWSFYMKYSKDHWVLKGVVASLWVLELTHEGLVGHTVWHYTVKYWGNLEALSRAAVWSLTAQIGVAAGIHFFVKLCFAARVYRPHTTNRVLSALILTFSFTTLALEIVLAYFTAHYPINNSRLFCIVLPTLASMVAADVLTSIATTYVLQSDQSRFIRGGTISRTVTFTSSTCILVNVASIVALVLYIVTPSSFTYAAICLVATKLSFSSLLTSLHSRIARGASCPPEKAVTNWDYQAKLGEPRKAALKPLKVGSGESTKSSKIESVGDERSNTYTYF